MVNIEFPSQETHDKSREVILFLAVVDGKKINCAISYETLRDHFGANYYDPVPAFVANRQRIEQLTTTLIRHGRFESDGAILIKSQDM